MNYHNDLPLNADFFNDIKRTVEQREQKAANKRRYTRFDHHSGTMLELKIRNRTGEWLNAKAFISDESFGGLGVVTVASDSLSINQPCQIQIPGIGWIEGRVAWLKALDNCLLEMGIKYSHV